MAALGLHLRIKKVKAKIAAVVTTALQMWHTMSASTWTGSDRLSDSSGNGNTAALYTGRGLSFDGVNDVVTIGNTGQTVKTVVFYVYPDTTTEVFMQLQSSGAVRIEISSGTLSATGFTSPTLYVDGAAGSTVAATTWQMIAVTSATGVSASNVLLGQSNTDYGSIDMSNVKFFSTELTAGQVAELYANPEQVLPTGAVVGDLVGWWDLNIVSNTAINGRGGKPGAANGPTNEINIPNGVLQRALVSQNSYCFFDGVNDGISIPTTLAPTLTSASLSIWAVFYDISFFDWIYGEYEATFNHNHAYIAILGSGTTKIGISVNTSSGGIRLTHVADFTPVIGTLYHIVGTYDENSIKLYVNGALTSTYNFPSTPYSISTRTSSSINVGPSLGGANKNIVFVASSFSSSLSLSEVQEIYNGGINYNLLDFSNADVIKAWYINTGNNLSDWVDRSTNGKDATALVGSPDRYISISGATVGKDIFGKNSQHVNSGHFIGWGNSYALITDSATLDITTNITLEAWVKPFTVAANQTAIGKNNAYALNITSGAKLQFQRWSSTSSGTVASSASLSVDTWYHIAATYDGTTTKLYINGAEDTSSGSITGAIDATATDVLMGALTSSTQLFSGYLDSVKIYDSVKTASEILENYNAEKNDHQN